MSTFWASASSRWRGFALEYVLCGSRRFDTKSGFALEHVLFDGLCVVGTIAFTNKTSDLGGGRRGVLCRIETVTKYVIFDDGRLAVGAKKRQKRR